MSTDGPTAAHALSHNYESDTGSSDDAEEDTARPTKRARTHNEDQTWEWRQNGTKSLNHYRCAQYSKGCRARKEVNLAPSGLETVRYRGAHTHPPPEQSTRLAPKVAAMAREKMKDPCAKVARMESEFLRTLPQGQNAPTSSFATVKHRITMPISSSSSVIWSWRSLVICGTFGDSLGQRSVENRFTLCKPTNVGWPNILENTTGMC